MQEQTKTRGSSGNLQGEQSENTWSQQNQIYYYSNFQLFQNNSNAHQFYQYSTFVEQLSKELGQQWRIQAELLAEPYINNRDIFLNLLSLWLKQHGPKLQTTEVPTFEQSFVNQFIISLKQPKQIQINQTSARAICMGFFLTANDIWTEMFNQQCKQQQPKNILFKSVTDTIQRTFKPIMVVRQKISNIFGKKKVKKNQNAFDTNNKQTMFQNCYHEFRKNLHQEKQLERQLNQFSLEEQSYEVSHKKMIYKEEFNEMQAPIKNNILSSMYKYVSEFLNRNHSWQVANSFVTNILQMNHINAQEGTRVKVLRPAQDFYHKLILVWLSFKGQNKIQFKQYLERVKSTFGSCWEQKYIIPTKYFFERITQNWEQIQSQMGMKKMNDKQLIKCLLSKIRIGMQIDWNKKLRISKKHKCVQQIIY